MKTTLYVAQILLVAGCIIGCQKKQELDAPQAVDAHQALHQAKYNQVLVEFPGHKYSMEIIVEEGSNEMVVAFITDAHFEPIAVEASEVKLNFIINDQPKTFTLAGVPQDEGQPARFRLSDNELATLINDGWDKEATASAEIAGAPYVSKLVKLSGQGHSHDHDSPEHTH